MRVLLLASALNQQEKDYRQQLLGKIAAIGAEVSYWDEESLQLPEAEVLVVLLTGQPLRAVDWLRIGAWRQQSKTSSAWPKKIVVAYDCTSKADQVAPLPDLFEHLAATERNFIYCLKDYIFFANRNGAEQK